VDFLDQTRSGIGGKICVVLFWIFVGWVLGSASPKFLSFANAHDTLFTGLGIVLGVCVGVFAALANSWLALILCFPVLLLLLLPN